MNNRIGNSRNHSEVCRQRIEGALANTEDGKARLQKTKDRLDEAFV